MQPMRLLFALAAILLCVQNLVISPPHLSLNLNSSLPSNATEDLAAALTTFHSVRPHGLLGSSGGGPSPEPESPGWKPNKVTGDAELIHFANKGSQLRCLMECTDLEAGESWPDPWKRQPASASSPWKGTLQDEMKTWFWKEGEQDEWHCSFTNLDPDNDGHARIQDALVDLGLSVLPRERGGDNKCYCVQHFDEDAVDDIGSDVPPDQQFYMVNGKMWQATGGYYCFGLNPTGGAIFGQDLKNPMTAADEWWESGPTVAEMPALRLGSDIMFAYWLRESPKPKNLRYYIVNHILNKDTVPIIARILKQAGHMTVPLWPGLVLNGGSGEAGTLVGSPIGATIAYMLIQHKAELGVKTIQEIVIFRDDGIDIYPELQLLFKIVDVAKPVGEDAAAGVVARGRGGADLDVRLWGGQSGGGYVDGVRTHFLVW